MRYKTFAPPFNLNKLVKCYWNLESDENELLPKDYFLMADSCPEIIFQYNEGFRNYPAQSARVRFQHAVHAQFLVAKRIGFFGVRLYPHAVNLLLKAPATEVVNSVCDFSQLFKNEGEALTDQIFHARTTKERINLISGFLIKKAAIYNADPINYFVEQLIRTNGREKIADLRKASGLSVKQFERRFKAVAGFSPKYFARIVRFQNVKSKYASAQSKTMTSLAYANNYYDQSHFNKEFKEFSGVQPLKFFKLMSADDSAERSRIDAKPFNFEGYLPCGWFA